MKLRWLFTFFIVLNGTINAQVMPVEQDHYTRFGHLTVDDGLPGNHITVIRQDTTGFIWVGTREGLARYDGTRFQTFRHTPGDSTSLPSNYINDVLITPGQKIFVATRNGLALFKPKKNQFELVPTLYEDGYGLNGKHIRALEDADEKHIWVETFNGTLHLLNIETFKADSWSHRAPTQPYYEYHALLQDSKGVLWIGGRNMGPLKWQNKNITPIKTDPHDSFKKRDRDVAFFFEDSDGDFWMGGLDGLYQYNREEDIANKRLHTSSYEMTESEPGILWIATGKGLARLDKTAKKITLYLPSENTPSSIIHDKTNCLTTDRKGNLWVGTDRGISILNPIQNLIHHYRHLPELTNSLSNNHVSDFMEDESGNIWVATRGGGLNRFDTETNHFEIFKNNSSSATSISSNHVSVLHQDDNKTIWTGLWRGIGFNRFDPQKGTFQRYALDSTSLKKDWYAGFQSWGPDTLVVGFWGAEGIRFFHKKESRWLPHNFRPAYHPADATLTKILAADSIVWVYQNGNFIRSFHQQNDRFEAWRSQVHHQTNQFHKINSVNLPDFRTLHQMVYHDNLTLFLTDEGTGCYNHQSGQFSTLGSKEFLMATQSSDELLLLAGDGIYSFDFNLQQPRKIIEGNQLPIPPTQITDFLILPDKKIAFCSSAGIQFIDLETENTIPVPPPFKVINQSKRPVRQIIQGSDNSFMVAFDRGIAYIPPTQKVEFYNTANAYAAGLKNDAIRNICECNTTPGFWISTDRGLFFFNTTTKQFSTIKTLSDRKINQTAAKDGQLFVASERGLASISAKNRNITFYNQPQDDMLSSHLTTFVKKDSKGNIWTGTTNKGINKIDRNTLKVSHFYPGHGFHGQEVLAFLETSNGVIYAGGDSLNIFNAEKELFELATIAKQLPHGKIQSLTEDHLGRILIVTTHNIHVFDPAGNRLFDLTPYLGTKTPTFTSATLKSSDNEIFTGSLNGFFQFNPKLFSPEEKKQMTLITRLLIMGEPQNLCPLETKPLKLKHNENFLEFFFSDMQYPASHDQYQYKLEGIDQDWLITNEASVSYKMLPPGSYTFQVQKINPFGGSIQAGYSFTILPPFWLSGWFFTIIILLIGTGIFFWWRHRINHFRLLENNLALKHQLLLSQMNPHFLFNALSAIQSFIFQNQPHAAGSYLAKFAKLMRLYLNNMASTVTTVHGETETLTHYLELQRLRHNNSFDYSIEVFPNQSHLLPGLPTMMVQPFVENAVEHGFQNMKEGQGFIRVNFTLQTESWYITISDNGLGIEESMARKNDNTPHRKSMSTEITKKRLVQLQKQYNRPCTLKIRDLSQQEGNQTGTEVSLVIPAIDMDKSNLVVRQ